jgi:hypothetical protein
MPYTGPVTLDIVVDQDGQKRLIGRQQKVGTPLEQGRGIMFRERFTLEAGRHGVRVLIALIVPNNVGAQNAAGVTPCSDLRFTANVGGTLTLAIQADPPPPVAPGTRLAFTLKGPAVERSKWRIWDGAQELSWPAPGPGPDFASPAVRQTWTPTQANPNIEIRAWARRANEPDSAAVMARLAFPVVGTLPATVFARDLYPVISSARCTSCHGGYNFFGPGGHHGGAPAAFGDFCAGCHNGAQNGIPFWIPPAQQQLFAGASAADLCNRFKTGQLGMPPHDAILSFQFGQPQAPTSKTRPPGTLTAAQFLGNLTLWAANPASPCQ